MSELEPGWLGRVMRDVKREANELTELRAENERLSVRSIALALQVQQLQEENARLRELLDEALKLIYTSSLSR